MTNDINEFDHEEIEQQAARPNMRASLGEAWRTNPVLKLMAILVVVAVALVLTFGVFSTPKQQVASNIGQAPTLDVVPGSKASPFLVEQNNEANAQRADNAINQGGSALPTPIGKSVDMSDTGSDDKSKDPLMEFRAETERLRQELKTQQEQSTQQIQALQTQVQAVPPAPPEPFDETLSQAMQQQLSQIMESWALKGAQVVPGAEEKEVKVVEAGASAGSSSANGGMDTAGADQVQSEIQEKPLISAGAVNYAQMLMEANSDVPGPIMAQILSGPLSGARAIGNFQVQDDYLIIHFTTATLKGREYDIDALALDPDTTLGGMATEVDHRYFTRVVLPAAGSFVAAFGQTLSQPETTTSVTSNGTVVVSQTKQGMKDAMYAGIGSVGNSVATFLNDQAARTKPLVRVATGTPLGIFFLSSVKKDGSQTAEEKARNSNFFVESTRGQQSQQSQQGGVVGYGNQQQSNPYGYGSMPYGNNAGYGYGANTQRYPTGVSVSTSGQGLSYGR